MEKLREQEIEEQKIEKQERKEILEVRDLHRSYFEAAEKVDTTAYIWYNIIIKYRRWYHG